MILVLDGSSDLSKEDFLLLEMIKERKAIVVVNKLDLGDKISSYLLNSLGKETHIVHSSIKNNDGIEKIYDEIENIVFSNEFKKNTNPLLTNIRHINLVQKACESLNSALEMINLRQALDFIEIDIKSAFDFLGEITGDTASDEVINTVFERFCLGK